MKPRRFTERSCKATSITEMPVVLFIFILGLLLPLIDLGFIAFRTSFIHTAASNAAHSAGRAQTFLTNGSKGELSAVNIAKRDALAVKDNGASGVNFSDQDISVVIIGTPIKAGKSPIRSTTPLQSIDTKDYLFQIEVSVAGQVDPLVTMSDTFFGAVPGLTRPMPVQATYKQFCEHPTGLSK